MFPFVLLGASRRNDVTDLQQWLRKIACPSRQFPRGHERPIVPQPSTSRAERVT